MFKDEQQPIDQRGHRGGPSERQIDPSPAEIDAATAVIRMGWTETERELRWHMARCRGTFRPKTSPTAESLSGWN